MSTIEQTIETLADCLRHPAGVSLGDLFAPSFFTHTPEVVLRARLDQLVRELGPARGVRICERRSARSARICCTFARGYSAHGELAIDEEQPARIQWLNFEFPTKTGDSWDDIKRDVRALPGRVSFEVRSLTRRQTLAEVGAEEPLGVGSVSKLVIFWCVVERVVSGEWDWDDVVVLEDRDRSLPTGILQDWPDEAPLTVHTAAALLISISDNTAADLLLRALGRQRVEAALRRLPLEAADANVPFFSTRGIFALVTAPEEQRRGYVGSSPSERRRILARLEAQVQPDLAGVTGAWPDGLDWYFSAAELGVLLDRIRACLVDSPEGRSILAMNKSLSLGQWGFAGFKGGSSAGRAAFAVLLESEEGEWWSVCLINNAKPEEVNVESRAQLIKRVADQLRT